MLSITKVTKASSKMTAVSLNTFDENQVNILQVLILNELCNMLGHNLVNSMTKYPWLHDPIPGALKGSPSLTIQPDYS
jgi:hypothetical protein